MNTTHEWVIVSAGAVVWGPSAWAPHALSQQLGLLGCSVSVGDVPSLWRSADGNVAVLPCTVIRPTYDAETQYLIGPTITLDGDEVSAEWAVEDRPLDQLKDERKIAVAAKRWEVEVGGLTMAGATIRTDRESQALINGAYALARDMLAGEIPAEPIDFKGVDGWSRIEPAAMVAIGRAVGLHVQACFRRERALAEAIEAAETLAALRAINITFGWPGQDEEGTDAV